MQFGSFPETHTYAQAGNYTVTVTATDSNNLTGSAQVPLQLLVMGTPGVASIWVAQAQASSDGKNAGQVTLAWNAPGASGCMLGVQTSSFNAPSTIPALQNPISVPCVQTQGGWTGTIPYKQPNNYNPSDYPMSYTFMLTGTAGIQSPISVDVYVLPRLTYGAGGQPFTSLTQYPASSPCASQFPVWDCWWALGNSDASCTVSACSAKQNGEANASVIQFGLAGFGFVQDSLTAHYPPSPFSSALPSGHTELLAVSANVQFNAIGGCVAIVGANDLAFQVEASDNSSNSYLFPSPAQETPCGGCILPIPACDLSQGVISVDQFWQGIPQLGKDIKSLMNAYYCQNTSGEIQYLINVLSDLGAEAGNVTAARCDIMPGTNFCDAHAPLWTATVPAGSAYEWAISPVIAFGMLGAGMVGAEGVNTKSTVSISGIAVPGGGGEVPPSSRLTLLPVSIFSRPAQPSELSLTRSGQNAVVRWQPPAHQGGEAINGYEIRWLGRGDRTPRTVTIGPNSTTYTLTGLKPGDPYAIGVAAIGRAGPGVAALTLVSGNRNSTYPILQSDDSSIVSSLEAKFAAHPVLKDRQIRVDSHSGVVAIAGLLASEAERHTAEEIVKAQRGVKRIIDELSIMNPRPSANITATDLSTAPNRRPRPFISGISPLRGPAYTIATITGIGLNDVTSVTFGGTPATFTLISQTIIKATVPDVSYADSTIKTLGPASQVGVTVTVKTASGSANSIFNYTGLK